MNDPKQEITQHYKLLLAANETGSICECDCGAIHLSYGPVVLNLSHQDFLEITHLCTAASEHMQSHKNGHLAAASSSYGRPH